jgi:hypothetical protein
LQIPKLYARWLAVFTAPTGGIMRSLRPLLKLILVLSVSTWFSACGGGGGGNGGDGNTDSDNTVDTSPPVSAANSASTLFTDIQTVALTSNETSAIYFSTDGSTPDISSDVYISPISVNETTVIKFFGVDASNNIESVQTETYTLEAQFSEMTTVPSDVTMIAYPKFYQPPPSGDVTVVDPFCALTWDVIAYPTSYLGDFPMPSLQGAPLSASIRRGVAVKDYWGSNLSNASSNIG